MIFKKFKGSFAFWNYIRDITQRLNLEINKNILKLEEKHLLMTDLSVFFQHFLSLFPDSEVHLSKKCLTLINILLERFENPNANEEMTAIIFVSKRLLAKYLKLLLEHYVANNPQAQMKIDFIVGHHSIYPKPKGTNDEFIKKIEDFSEIGVCENDIINEVFTNQFFNNNNKKTNISPNLPNLIDMRFKLPDQIKTIKSFRNKHINVLISTSVTEEGLDIPECNLVVSFSEPKTIKSFIQLKGRARKERSEYIILAPESRVFFLEGK